MTAPDFEDQPPQTDRLSAYDERHLVTYLRLLDAEKTVRIGKRRWRSSSLSIPQGSPSAQSWSTMATSPVPNG